MSDDNVKELFNHPCLLPAGDVAGPLIPGRWIRDAYELFAGLAYLHRAQWLHNDIQPANLGMYGNHLVITSFDKTRRCYDERTTAFSPMGPEIYQAPEIQENRRFFSSADIWAAGCTIFEIITGERLFGPSRDDRSLAVQRSDLHMILTKANLPPGAYDLIITALNPDKRFRLSATLMLGHSVFYGLSIPAQTALNATPNYQYVYPRQLTETHDQRKAVVVALQAALNAKGVDLVKEPNLVILALGVRDILADYDKDPVTTAVRLVTNQTPWFFNPPATLLDYNPTFHKTPENLRRLSSHPRWLTYDASTAQQALMDFGSLQGAAVEGVEYL